MPDRYRFDHLGARVECIDCGEGGPRCPFPEHAYSDWTGAAGQRLCGVCHPRVIEGKGREKSADDGEGGS